MMALLAKSSAVKFVDSDDDFNNMVEKTAKTVMINPIIVVQQQNPESSIGKFSFSQALDYAEG